MSAETSGTFKAGQNEALDRNLAFIGIADCKCEHAKRPLGRLHGVNMGKGWVRITTHPDCRYHGTAAEKERAKRTKQRRLNDGSASA